MKKTFVFDKGENDILNIDESTVIKETGIDAAKVKESIMKQIKNEKKTKKISAKKIFSIVAIAAAITAAATVTVQATTGVFNPAFGEFFAGQPANGVFPGSDLSVKSNTLDIEFVGVTGDETEMYSVYNITKKDGGNFVDTTDSYCFLGTNAEMNVSESAYKKFKLMMDGTRGYGSGVAYDFIDEKTIRATAVYSDTAGCIKGETLTVTDNETTYYRIDEVLYSDMSDTFMGCSDFMEENKEFMDKKEASLKKDQTIIPIIDEGHAKLVVATTATIPFEYELSVKLNYKTTEKTFSAAEGRKFNEFNSDWTVTNIKAGSFGLVINASTEQDNTYADFDMENQENWSQEKLHEFFNISTELKAEITLEDGTKVYAVGDCTSSTDADGKGEKSWNCVYYTDESLSKPYALDSSKITSIKVNGTELIG